MDFIDQQLLNFKTLIEDSILSNGTKGKDSIIRSSMLINLIHDAVKYEFIKKNVDENNIYPKIYKTKPELKIAGFF